MINILLRVRVHSCYRPVIAAVRAAIQEEAARIPQAYYRSSVWHVVAAAAVAEANMTDRVQVMSCGSYPTYCHSSVYHAEVADCRLDEGPVKVCETTPTCFRLAVYHVEVADHKLDKGLEIVTEAIPGAGYRCLALHGMLELAGLGGHCHWPALHDTAALAGVIAVLGADYRFLVGRG